jgi:hypothetical protein
MKPDPNTWEGRMAIKAAERSRLMSQREYEEAQAELERRLAEQANNPTGKPDCDECWSWTIGYHPMIGRGYMWRHVIPDWWPEDEERYVLSCDHECHESDNENWVYVAGGRPIAIA